MRRSTSPSTRRTEASSALQTRAVLFTMASSTDCRSPGERAIMRRMSLVAACCSAPSRISCACAAIVFFNIETDSWEEVTRFPLVFLVFFFIYKKTRLEVPVRVNFSSYYSRHDRGLCVVYLMHWRQGGQNRSDFPFISKSETNAKPRSLQRSHCHQTRRWNQQLSGLA